MKRYIRKKGSKHIHEWTAQLAKNKDMQECDANGQPVVPKEDLDTLNLSPSLVAESAPEVPPNPETDSAPATMTVSKAELEEMTRPDMNKLAKQLGLNIAPATGEAKMRAAISAVLFPED